jgi:DNA-binding beta-propeller fold protein YncE
MVVFLFFNCWGCAAIKALKNQEAEAVGPEYVFFPPLPEEPRIQFLTGLSDYQDFAPTAKWSFKDFVMGKEDMGRRRVEKPYGVAIRDGIIYVCDTQKNVITALDIAGEGFWNIKSERERKIIKPINIVVTEDGSKYIADAMLGEVIVLDRDDNLVVTLKSDDIKRPTGVAVYKDKIFVVCIKNDRVVVFEKGSWKQLYTFGKKGKKPGEFLMPSNLTVDGDGNIYVSETFGYRIQKLTADGTPLKIFGQGLGDSPGQFARLRGVAVDREGRIYCADAMNNVVQVFDQENRLLLFFGQPGETPGCLTLPAQVIVDYDNVALFEKYASPDFKVEYLVIITSQFGTRMVNVFGFGRRIIGVEADNDGQLN